MSGLVRRADSCIKPRGAKRTPSASLSAAAPLILRGVSKGEKPQFRPFESFQGGAGGNRNPPAFLFRGPGGHSLFKREYPLWLLASETGAALCAKDPFPLPRHGNVPLREQRTMRKRTAMPCAFSLAEIMTAARRNSKLFVKGNDRFDLMKANFVT